MKKLLNGAPETRSADAIDENIGRLKALFPEAFAEGKVDFDVLRQLLGDAVDGSDEKYGLNWHGKRRARQLALTPSTGTLRPCPDDSVDWDATQNLMIEGDNLEVLKLLQKSYAGKVKLIYIDPPYNTGHDFVYSDDYRDTIKNYLELTGQIDGENRKLSSNAESSGRFHTDWLNMIYPRLRLARDLLAKDGVIFISIDETELPNLRLVMDDVFGSENQVVTLTVLCNPRGRAQDKHFATTHEYLVCYSRSILEKGAFEVPKDLDQIQKEYSHTDDRGRYRHLELRNTHREFGKHNRPNLYYPLFAAEDGTVSTKAGKGRTQVFPDWNDGFEGCWTWGLPKVRANLNELLARKVSGRTKIMIKDRAEGATRMLKTIMTDKAYATDKGQKTFNELFETKVKIFESPKSLRFLSDLIATRTNEKDTVMDFFAGSGTAAHSVMALNASDGIQRKFLLVQLPEPTRRKDYGTVSEITKERLRRAGAKIKEENPDYEGDLGFRVFKLDQSNIRAWDPAPDDLESALQDAIDHIRPGRTEQDILYELLLKLGLDLCAPIETREVAGKTVHSAGGGTLIACLDERIASEEAEALASGIADWHAQAKHEGETTVIFRDSAFADDIAKTNVAAILNQRGLKNVRSL